MQCWLQCTQACREAAGSTGLRSWSVLRWLEGLMISMIHMDSCLAVQLIRTGFSYLKVILVMPTTRHRHIFLTAVSISCPDMSCCLLLSAALCKLCRVKVLPDEDVCISFLCCTHLEVCMNHKTTTSMSLALPGRLHSMTCFNVKSVGFRHSLGSPGSWALLSPQC